MTGSRAKHALLALSSSMVAEGGQPEAGRKAGRCAWRRRMTGGADRLDALRQEVREFVAAAGVPARCDSWMRAYDPKFSRQLVSAAGSG